MPTNNHFSLEAKAEALTALIVNEGNVLKTAQQLGLAESTLRSWAVAAEGEQRESLVRLREQKRTKLREQFESLAEQCLGIVAAKLNELSPRDAMICAGIATDKLRLLGEEPTSISRSIEADSARVTLFRERYANRESASVTLTTTDVEAARALLAGAKPPAAD